MADGGNNRPNVEGGGVAEGRKRMRVTNVEGCGVVEGR